MNDEMVYRATLTFNHRKDCFEMSIEAFVDAEHRFTRHWEHHNPVVLFRLTQVANMTLLQLAGYDDKHKNEGTDAPLPGQQRLPGLD